MTFLKVTTFNRFRKTKCEEILNSLISFPICYPFLQLIDPERDGAPDYYQFVSKPMALVEVKRKLSEDKYKTIQEFKDDIELIWSNAKAYNGDGTLFTDMALEARHWFNKKMKHFPDTPEQEWAQKVISISKRLFKLSAHPPPEIDPHGDLKVETLSDDELNEPLPPQPEPQTIRPNSSTDNENKDIEHKDVPKNTDPQALPEDQNKAGNVSALESLVLQNDSNSEPNKLSSTQSDAKTI